MNFGTAAAKSGGLPETLNGTAKPAMIVGLGSAVAAGGQPTSFLQKDCAGAILDPRWAVATVAVTYAVDGDPIPRWAKTVGKRLGNVFVHRSASNYYRWRVSSTLTGYLICTLHTEQQAQLVAQVLDARCGLALSKRTKPEVVRLMPKWVRQWLQQCVAVGKYLDPAEHGMPQKQW